MCWRSEHEKDASTWCQSLEVGTGRPADAIISPVAGNTAVPLKYISKILYGNQLDRLTEAYLGPGTRFIRRYAIRWTITRYQASLLHMLIPSLTFQWNHTHFTITKTKLYTNFVSRQSQCPNSGFDHLCVKTSPICLQVVQLVFNSSGRH